MIGILVTSLRWHVRETAGSWRNSTGPAPVVLGGLLEHRPSAYSASMQSKHQWPLPSKAQFDYKHFTSKLNRNSVSS